MDRKKTITDNIFLFKVALDIIRSDNVNATKSDEESEPQTVEECRCKNDWSMWKWEIQAELDSLAKREVFGPIAQIPKG